MKRILFLVLFLSILPLGNSWATQDPSMYAANCLNGENCLDSIDVYFPDPYNLVIRLQDGDVATVITTTGVYNYTLDIDSGAAESSPSVIKPDYYQNAAYSGAARWKLVDFYFEDATIQNDLSVGNDISITGNSTVGGNSGVTGNSTVGGTQTVTGTGIFINDLTVGNDLAVDNNMTVGGNQTVTGTGIFNNDVTVNADLTAETVNGDVSLNNKYSCDLAAAITAIGSTETKLVVDCDAVIADGVTVTTPLNVNLYVDIGNTISGTAGGSTETLAINGHLVAGAYQIFGSNITVSGSPKIDVLMSEWWGATGDGNTEDTTAILAAATLSSSTGVVLLFQDKTYILGNYTWPANINMRGAGMNRTIIKWKASSAESNLINLPSSAVDVIVRDITFDANVDNQSDSTGYYGTFGGTISNASRVIFDRCEFKNGRIVDIYIQGPTGSGQYAEVDIRNCRFYDGMVGTATRGAQAVSVSEGIRLRATGNDFRQPTLPASYGRGGIVMQRPAGSTSLSWGQYEATGNSFVNFGRMTADRLGCLYVYSGSEATTISNNRFENSVGSAITVKSDSGNTTITGNTVYTHNDAAIAAMSFFDQADTYSLSLGRNLIVSGNVVDNPEYMAYYIDGGRSGLGDFQVATFSNNTSQGGLRAVHFKNVDTLKVVGNTFTGTTGIAIFGEDCAGNIDISGNTLSTGVIGIDINGTTTSAIVSIQNNKIGTMSDDAISIRSSVESFHIEGNIISDCNYAFDTRGASGFSTIRNNIGRGLITGAWNRSGTYTTGTQFLNNILDKNLSGANRTLSIDGTGAVTVLMDWHLIETETGTGTDPDSLTTINGGYEGRRVVLFAANSTRDIVVTDGATIILAGGANCTLDNIEDSIELIYRNNVWVELSRSDNGA